MKSIGAVSQGRPTSIRHPDEERSVRSKAQPNDGSWKVFEKGETSALILAIDFLEEDPVHRGVREFSNEQLSIEGAEFSILVDHLNVRRTAAHLVIGEPNRRRHEFRATLEGFRIRLIRFWNRAHLEGRVGRLEGSQRLLVAIKDAGSQVVDWSGGDPRSLLI